MIHRITAVVKDGKVDQTQKVQVNTCVYGRDTVTIGDIVFVRSPAHCPDGSIGFVREIGVDGMGTIKVRVDLIKADPMSWPRNDVWFYQDELTKAFTEKWFAD